MGNCKKWCAGFVIAICMSSPAVSDDQNAESGLNLMGRGAELLMQELLRERAREFAELEDLLDDMKGSFDAMPRYHAPQILPNGDILIRCRLVETPQNDIEL